MEPISSIPVAPDGFRSGFVALVGRPNVGKSTLFNHLLGQKVAITSPVAQTTRNRLRGILTTATAQLIFVDTPGIHKPHHRLGEVLVHNAKGVLNRVDAIVFVVDAASAPGGGDRYVAELLAKVRSPVLLAINKIDLLPAGERPQRQQDYQTLGPWPAYPCSALTGEGVGVLQSAIEAQLPLGPYYYPPEMVTDQPERFIMAELIREQILHHTREEVPHSVAVTIEQVQQDRNLTRVHAVIYVERPTQKAIIIGQGGQLLKQMGTAARQEIQTLIGGKIYLELFVKVRPRWRQDRLRLAELGYRIEKD
ncbi:MULTISPECIES: GTPase Era [unclassified Thermosynechococcus]|uniref:GTPase Era n=1 Tax=unclassified Thermosynechococcus TaxID=2622553 RepID=UPI002857C22C|nr:MULTISPECIES: GTPase Era [unclassified Thermosynechococcus]MDR5639446.1 GTPase Era [Thermosynechococcus sp. PP42]WNC23490.1 GTPase Era [Thermosynechococcus sp. PP22]WNC31273.1 GTPase Era [Thermosynechococcus sp. PKX95]WNC33797.1 GTPase Era [Thermosynechococcus sp. PKX91]WNC36322.1 GTPase Era [Thermosynechococcus sp. WL11]